MGHIPTITVSVFAAILSGLYFAVPESMQFTMLAFLGAAWFLAGICWLAQKSADYARKYGTPSHAHSEHTEKDKESHGSHNPQNSSEQLQQQQEVEGHGGSSDAKGGPSEQEIEEMKTKLTNELESLRSQLQNKDEEIERLQGEINNLKTLVQIESLKSELANLKVLAAKEDQG